MPRPTTHTPMQPRENTDNLPVEAPPPGQPAMHGCVLVAEDDDVQADLLSVALTQAGYEVRMVQGGQAALDSVDAGPPDLILMDAALPGVDGYEATRRLKASDEARFIPVVHLDGPKERRGRGALPGGRGR